MVDPKLVAAPLKPPVALPLAAVVVKRVAMPVVMVTLLLLAVATRPSLHPVLRLHPMRLVVVSVSLKVATKADRKRVKAGMPPVMRPLVMMGVRDIAQKGTMPVPFRLLPRQMAKQFYMPPVPHVDLGMAGLPRLPLLFALYPLLHRKQQA